MDWSADDRDKALAVVLNKVDGLWFAYYAIDLSSPHEPLPEADARAVLAAVTAESDGFHWRGSDAQRTALFSVLLEIFNDHPELSLEAFRRIFDMNVVPEESGANAGMIGQLNRTERQARLDKYLDAVRNRSCEGRAIIVAEGDSWFQFPGRWFFSPIGTRWLHVDAVKDILDHLIASKRYCVNSLAAGGDWLFQMLRANDYVEPLSQIEPDVFLLSGGGNDLLGDGRVANMTLHQRRAGITARHREILAARLAAVEGRRVVFDRTTYEAGLRFIAKEFVSFLNLVLVQYFIFLSSIARSKLAKMAIITHGYDFALPTQHSTARLISLRRLVNKWMGSGKWLWIPLEQKRLNDDEKKAVIYTMITEFNEVLVSLAMSPKFPHLYHVDCRGVARSPADWYDEIHLTSKAFKRAELLFEACITDALRTGDGKQKVVTIADLR
jgi:hypothetical protein